MKRICLFFITTVVLLSLVSVTFAQPGYYGTKGLLRTISADNQGKHFLSLTFHLNYNQDNVSGTAYNPQDAWTQRNAHGYLSGAFAPMKYVEFSGGIGSGLFTDKAMADRLNDNKPTKFGFGSTYLGVKLSFDPFPFLWVGTYGFYTIPTGSSELQDFGKVDTSSTMGGIGAVTFDLANTASEIPLKLHLNVGMLIDNDDPAGVDANLNDPLLVRGGVVLPAGSFDLMVEASTERFINNDAIKTHPTRITPGVRFYAPGSVMDFGVEIGLNDAEYDWRLVWGISLINRIVKEKESPIMATVTGTVMDKDKNEPLSDAKITVRDSIPKNFSTNTDGIYRFRLGSGPHDVIFEANGYKSFSKVVVVNDTLPINLNVLLEPLVTFGTVTGNVSNSKTGEPMGVTLKFDKDDIPSIKSDPNNGSYSVELPVGRYTISVDEPEYYRKSEVVIIEKGKTVQRDFALTPIDKKVGSELKGKISDANTNVGISAIITLENFGSYNSDSETGLYEIKLPEGSYNMKVEADGYITDAKVVILKDGQTTVENISLKPVPKAMITGKVTDTKTNLPVQAEITFPGKNISPIMADENGIYSATLPPGTYTVKASYPEYVDQAFPVVIKDNETTMRDFELIKKGEKITLSGIYFDFNKSTIKPESYPVLDKAVKILKDNPTIRVRIEGHTDSVGSEDYNQKLSQARADAVKSYLVKTGEIDINRIDSVGKGEAEPIASNETDEGRSLNRRIEFVVVGEN